MSEIYDLSQLFAAYDLSDPPVVGRLIAKDTEGTYLWGSFSAQPCLSCVVKRLSGSAWVDRAEYVSVPARLLVALGQTWPSSAKAGRVMEGRLNKGKLVAQQVIECLPLPSCRVCHEG
jgi:hypothetical protein